MGRGEKRRKGSLPAGIGGRVPGSGAQDRFLEALERLFLELAGRREFQSAYPGFAPLLRGLEGAAGEEREDALAALYSHLHGSDSAYSPAERRELDGLGGYWCHAGGFSPLRRAAGRIGPETHLADYGAGNGLQGLLFQYLYPHRRTTLIELSGAMIERGRRLQSLMGVETERVRWLHRSVVDVPPAQFDFIYIYRPLRPEGEEGRRFYTRFAEGLSSADREITIFSIADCLRGFLPPSFRAFYDDGQLTCFTNGDPSGDTQGA